MSYSEFFSDLDTPGRFKLSQPCQIGDDLCVACDKIRRTQCQIKELRRTLNILIEEHREMRAQVNDVHDPFSSRCPPEVVSRIMQACLPSTLRLYNERRDLAISLTLASVCQNWRRIALSTRQLWNVIVFDGNRSRTLSLGLDTAREWLLRSGRLPLAIHIFWNAPIAKLEDLADDIVTKFRAFVDLLNQHSSRWQSLNLKLDLSFFPLFCGDSNAVDNLHILRLEDSNSQSRHAFSSRDVGFKTRIPSSKLCEVQLENVHLKSVHIDWNQVSTVSVRGLYVDECHEIIKRTLHLRKFDTTRMSFRPQDQSSVPENIITSPELQYLAIRRISPPGDVTAANMFINNIVTPALERLLLGSSIDPSEIKSLLGRSYCTLRELRILEEASFALNNSELVSLLEDVPSLTRLEIQSARLFNRLSKRFVSEGRVFLPALEVLKISSSFEDILPRWRQIPEIFNIDNLSGHRSRPLRTLQIHVRSHRPVTGTWKDAKSNLTRFYIDKDSLLRILSLLRSGLNIEIRDPERGIDFIEASRVHQGVLEDIVGSLRRFKFSESEGPQKLLESS